MTQSTCTLPDRPLLTARGRAGLTARGRAGAARVSIIWLITLIILFFVALGFGYVGFGEAAKQRVAAERARAEAEQANQRFQADADHIIAVSDLTGFYDTTAATPRAIPEAITAALDDLRGTFPDMGPEVDELAKALPIMKQAYAAKLQEIATLKSSIDTLKSEQATMNQTLRETIAQKDEELSKLQKQISDDSANAASKQSELEERIATLNSQRNDLDAQVRQLKGDVAALERQHQDDRQTWETRTRSLSQSLKFLEEPERPDGEVLAVSKDLNLGWIDLGARQRLASGTRFQITSGKLGSTAIKATAEVTRVEPDKAEIRITDVTDPFNPVVAGDRIFNPLYDPYGERHAVLAGRFTGQFDEAKLRVLLKDMGITVQDQLDFNTDYLILGSDIWTDAEGNQLEEPMSPTELPIYKDAEANGVQIVSIKKLASYFTF